jgi:hypothetical protein
MTVVPGDKMGTVYIFGPAERVVAGFVKYILSPFFERRGE